MILRNIEQSKRPTYKDVQASDKKTDILECCICMETLKNEHMVVQLPCHLNHIFHKWCFVEYIECKAKSVKPNCPCCKADIDISSITK